ncbi:hypothetical protein ACRALDRAFT_2112316 [Sodiomyces alcalophilus JCM 7366]|uniref:uncharacterized protein n=1 Tax=Sodiomyces alcalophilus JCM 7366 TaxID=591952 RepID=UPI0039B3A114
MPNPPPKTTRQQHSPHKRTRIVALHEAGLTYREIARREGVAPGTVGGICKRYRDQESAKSLPRSGRPRILNERDIRHILRLLNEDPSISYEQLRRKANLECSSETIKRELVRQGIRHIRTPARPKPTPQHTENKQS